MHSECSFYGIRVNMSDGDEPAVGNFNVFLPSEDEVRKSFEILKEGRTVDSDLAPRFWTSLVISI